MKRTIFLLVTACLVASVTVCNAEAPEKSEGMRTKYCTLIQRAFSDLTVGYGLSDSIIVNLIPVTKEEYAYFISMSKHDNDCLSSLTRAYYKYMSLLETKASPQDPRMYGKIMYISEFVQGDFVEFYNELTDKLVGKDPAFFCSFYKKENSPKLSKLQRYHQGCK